jgi:hypothetical protein
MTRQTREQLLVRVLLSAMQTALRVRRAESVSADVRDETDAALQAAFAPIWDALSHIELHVSADAIEFDGGVVLSGPEDAEGLIPSLVGSGIRSLSLAPGAELEEIKLVLTAVAAAGSGAGDGSDLQTSLFRADLHHIQYVATGPTPSAPTSQIASARPDPEKAPELLRESVRRDAAESPPSGVVRLESFDSTLYFLDEREIEYLKSSIDREYAQDLAVNAITLFLDILELRSAPSVREEVIAILSGLLPDLLASGNFEAVAHLVSGIREVARDAVELTETQKEALDRLRGSISNPRAIFQLFHALEAGGLAPTPESMGVLLRELRPDAVRQVLGWSDQLSDAGTRDAVVSALDSFFTAWPLSLVRMLTASERDVVQAGLSLAGRLKLPEFVDIVGDVTSHDDVVVRRLAAETLASIGTSSALRRLADMAGDDDRDVRVAAYRCFAARPYRGAFSALENAITAKDLEDKGEGEKRALFEAFGAVAGADGVEILTQLLKGKSLSVQRPSPHTRACAATALGRIATSDARAALERAAKDRAPLVRAAVGSALRGEG